MVNIFFFLYIVIGRRHEHADRLEKETGAKIELNQKENSPRAFRTISLTGSLEAKV